MLPHKMLPVSARTKNIVSSAHSKEAHAMKNCDELPPFPRVNYELSTLFLSNTESNSQKETYIEHLKTMFYKEFSQDDIALLKFNRLESSVDDSNQVKDYYPMSDTSSSDDNGTKIKKNNKRMKTKKSPIFKKGNVFRLHKETVAAKSYEKNPATENKNITVQSFERNLNLESNDATLEVNNTLEMVNEDNRKAEQN